MISFLQGKLIEKSSGKIIIEVGDLGFEAFVSEECLRKIGTVGKQVKLFTRVVFKQQEGVFETFGFLTSEEKEMFLLLTSVDKIGPRTALNVLGSAPIEKIRSAISHGKTEFLNKVVGIGEKEHHAPDETDRERDEKESGDVLKDLHREFGEFFEVLWCGHRERRERQEKKKEHAVELSSECCEYFFHRILSISITVQYRK